MSTDTVATTEAASAAPLGDTPVLEVTDLTVTFGGLNGNPDVRDAMAPSMTGAAESIIPGR